MLAVGLAGTVLAGLLGVDGAGDPLRADAQADAKSDDTTSPSRRTRPSTAKSSLPTANPMAGATVILSRWQRILNGIGDDYVSNKKSESFRKTTGLDGRFTFATGNRRPGDRDRTRVRPGLSLEGPANPSHAPAIYRSTAGWLISKGGPVAGVKVTLGQVWLAAPTTLRGPLPRQEIGVTGDQDRACRRARRRSPGKYRSR